MKYLKFFFVFQLQSLVHLNLWGDKGGHLYKLEVGIANKFAGQPEERLFKVVVALGTDVVVLNG